MVHYYNIIELRTKIMSCEIFINCSKMAFAKLNMTPNIDYLRDHRCEKQIWFTDVKYLRLSTEHFMCISTLNIYTCV